MGSIITKLKELFYTKKLEIALLGLELSGKSTIVYKLDLSDSPIKPRGPTIGVDVRNIKKNNISIKIWDVGGQVQYRSEWVQYATGTDVIIFVIDTSDRERITQVKSELFKLISNSNVQNIPILFLGNKIDIENHMTEKEIIDILNLDYIKNRVWAVIMISALNNVNITNVLDWLIKIK